MIHTGKSRTFDDLAETVEQTVEELRPHVRKFDSIIVTGISGQAVGFPVALALKKPIVVRRKMGEDSHGVPGELINAPNKGDRVLFLDDFVSIGRTYARCALAVERYGATVVGSYAYAYGYWSSGPDEAPRFEHWGPSGVKKPRWARRIEDEARLKPSWLQTA